MIELCKNIAIGGFWIIAAAIIIFMLAALLLILVYIVLEIGAEVFKNSD